MIKLDARYHHQVNLTIQDELPQIILHSLRKIESEENVKLKLQEFCLTVIPLTFQYFALLLSSEYLTSKSEPDVVTTESLWSMIKRPGAGKWVGFIRNAIKYFKNHKPIVIEKGVIEIFYKTLISNDRPIARWIGTNGEVLKKLDYCDALIHLRNQFAHSRNLSEEKSTDLFNDYFPIWIGLVDTIKSIFSVDVLISDIDNMQYDLLSSKDSKSITITPSETNQKLILWNSVSNNYIKLFPFVIPEYSAEANNGEALLLEEVKIKKITYLYKDEIIQKKEEYKNLMQMLGEKTIEQNFISSSELTSAILGERINTVTRKTLTAYEDARKYIPGMFIERKFTEENLNNWLEDNRPGCILVGEPGTGKTSFVADWCIKQTKTGNFVLLIEASKLHSSDISEEVKKLLSFKSSLAECFRAVNDEIKSRKSETKRLIIIIDAVNEFLGNNSESRLQLWHDLNVLVEKIKDYSPYFKCLITTRSDLWTVDFPKKDGVGLILKSSLYYKMDDNIEGFPCLWLKEFTMSEVENVYDKVKKNIPGMSPITEFNNLPNKTKKAILNPFMLRLILQTYNGEEVPSVNTKNILKKFSEEKALDDKIKTKILFKLLERMSELRNSDITLEEFISGSKVSNRRNRKREKELSEIIFNPKSESPYKELISDGLLEEYTVESEGEIVEKISFAQEKVTTIFFNALKKKRLLNYLKNFSYVVPFFLAIFFLLNIAFNIFSNKLSGLIPNYEQSKYFEQLNFNEYTYLKSMAISFIERFSEILFLSVFFTLLIFLITFFLTGLTEKFTSVIISKRIHRDLPSTYLREIWADIHKKYMVKRIFPILIIILIIYILIQLNSIYGKTKMNELFFSEIKIFLIYFFLAVIVINILSEIKVTIKYANHSSLANILFGKNEFVNDFFSSFVNLVLIGQFIIAGYISIGLLKKIQTDLNLLKIKNEILLFMEKHNIQETYKLLDFETILFEIESMQKMFLDFGVYIVLVYLGLIITHLALTWIVADPLGKYLKIKLLK